MTCLPLFLILAVYGGARFLTALQTGVLTGPKLGARRADQPVTCAVNMTILGGAVIACLWMVVGSVHSMHFSIVRA